MPYSLKFDDRKSKVSLSPALSFDPVLCEQGFIVLGEGLNRLELAVTAEQFKKLFSAMMVGSELLWPDDNQDLQALLLQAASCPIDASEADCIEYPPSSSFIRYFPDNPYIVGDKSAGWNKEAWYRWGSFDTLFPDWIDNWISGFVGSLTGYEQEDILFNIESIPISPIDAFLSGGGILPKIEIRFSGTGVIEVELLSFPLGGRAIIELDNEPNALDILTGGIIDPNSFLVELNRDIVSFPPEEYPILNIEIPIETAGNHVLYIVFLPAVDDSLIPIGFGGGIRSVELCGLTVDGGAMGIEQIFWDGCELKQLAGGVETTIVTAAQIQSCLDLSGVGGGTAGNLIARPFHKTLSSSITTTSTSYATGLEGSQLYTPTKKYQLVHVSADVQNSAANSNYLRPVALQSTTPYNGQYLNEARGSGAAVRHLETWDLFVDLPKISTSWQLEYKVSAGTMTILSNKDIQWLILEFDDVSEIYVEDIRISGGELQKKIGGIWLNVTDSFEAIISNLQAQVSSALANAAAAVTVANNADDKADLAIAVNNTQNTRLDNLELWRSTATTQLIDHENRITALEYADTAIQADILALQAKDTEFQDFIDGSAMWWHTFTFTLSDNGWEAGTGAAYVAGNGFSGGAGAMTIRLPSVTIPDAKITDIAVRVRRISGGADNAEILFAGADVGNLEIPGDAQTALTWYRVGNRGSSYIPEIKIQSVFGGLYYITAVDFLGHGNNPFD